MARLLIVDDDPVICRLLQAQLWEQGYICVTAQGAADARRVLASESFDLMLADICMPGETGLELARYTREAYAQMGVLVVSGMGDPREAEVALEIGVFGYLVKPFDKSQLFISVKGALARREYEKRRAAERTFLERSVRERSRNLRDLVERLRTAQGESEATARQFAQQTQLFQVLLDAIPSPIYYADPHGCVLGCNMAFAKRLLRRPNEIAGRDLAELAPELAAVLHRPGSALADACDEEMRELELVFPDGTCQQVLVSRSLLRDAHGEIGGMVSILVDISERRAMELKLASSERYQRAIWESIPSGIILVEVDSHRILDANPQAARMVGLPRDQLVGHTCHGFLCPALPGCCPLESWDGPFDGRECVLLTADGRQLPVLKAATAIDVDGRRILIESFLDISDRKATEIALQASEEKVRQITENIGIGISLISPEMRILNLNHQMRQWCPAIRVEEQPHCYAAFYDPPRAEVCAGCPVQRTFIDGQVHELMTEPQTDNGQKSYRLVSSPIRDRDGRVAGAIEMVEDVTERAMLERELRQAQKLESIGQLAAGIAHEINTPTQYVGDNTRFLREAFDDVLGVVRGLEPLLASVRAGQPADVLLRSIEERLGKADMEFLSQEVPKAIDQTLEGVDRIMRIVRSMKEFSHPGSSERVPADVNKALDTTITVARNEWKYVADVETDFDPALPTIPCFAGEINQVFLNILINAAQAIGEVVERNHDRKGKIRISTRLQGAWVEIRFCDSGGGIPKFVQHRIFDPFFTTKQLGKGTGQGLAIAHRVVVEKHGGTLTFETEEGCGTTFVIRLPVQPGGAEKVA